MTYDDINSFASRAVVVKFKCPNCRTDVESEEIDVPEPDYAAERDRDSEVMNDDYAICSKCGNEYHIAVTSTYTGGYVTIDGLDENDKRHIEELPLQYDDFLLEAIRSNTGFYNTFLSSISRLKTLSYVHIDDQAIHRIHVHQLYASTITCLETYLSDAFINTVQSEEKYIRQFVATFKDFKDRKFSLSEFYGISDSLETIVEEELLKVIYHHLAKVSSMYKDTFGVHFPPGKEIYRAIEIRHDIVHRNGRTKNGDELDISKSDLTTLFERVESFIDDVDKQLKALV